MRLSVFLALLVATFLACSVSFASAEEAAHANDVQPRRLRSDGIPLTGVFADTEDRAAAEIAVKFINTMKQGAARKAAERAAELAVKGAVLDHKAVSKVGKMVADAAKGQPKQWSTLKKIVVGVLGASAAAAVFAFAYNQLKPKAATTAA